MPVLCSGINGVVIFTLWLIVMQEPENYIPEFVNHLVPVTKVPICITKQQICKTKPNLTRLCFEIFVLSFCDSDLSSGGQPN